MAIVNRGFDLTSQYGSIGGVTYRRIGGVTVASQKVPAKSHAKQTLRLMLTRMRWVNLVQLWRAIDMTSWHPAFAKENKRISDFNEFMKANVNANLTFITKSISNAMGCVVAPVTLTSPSYLPTISVNFGNNDVPVSSLSVGTLTIGNSTTLKAFSDAIINNNNGWMSGDKLTILIVLQSVDSYGVPRATADALEITLDSAADYDLLSDHVDVSLLSVVDGHLALTSISAGGVAFVHSRIVDSDTITSYQSLVVNNSYLSQYQGRNAFNAAVESYGGFAEPQTLTPDVPDADFIFNP